jgi:hypothetical protein
MFVAAFNDSPSTVNRISSPVPDVSITKPLTPEFPKSLAKFTAASLHGLKANSLKMI